MSERQAWADYSVHCIRTTNWYQCSAKSRGLSQETAHPKAPPSWGPDPVRAVSLAPSCSRTRSRTYESLRCSVQHQLDPLDIYLEKPCTPAASVRTSRVFSYLIRTCHPHHCARFSITIRLTVESRKTFSSARLSTRKRCCVIPRPAY